MRLKRQKSELPPRTANSDTSFFKKRVQTKLSVGQPGDKFEKEADSVADKVVNQSGSGDVQKAAQPEEEKVQQKPLAESISSVQMKEMGEEEKVQQQPEAEKDEQTVQKKDEEKKDEAVQKKGEKDEQEPVQKMAEKEEPEAVQKKDEEKKEDPLQKKADDTEKDDKTVQKKEEEKEPLQKKEAEKKDETVQQKEEEKEPVQQKGNGSSAPPATEKKLSASKGQGSPMSGALKQDMESGFGADLGNVRIHNDSQAEQMSQEMGAQAFTHGNDVYFNKGKFNPESKEGRHLLAHELTHTIQQKGMVQKKVQRHMQKTYPWEGMIANTWNAALRGTPGKSSVLADLPKGTAVKVTGNSGNWLKVSVFAGGRMQTGYVSQELVELNAGKISDRQHFEQYPVVKESSGWLMGENGTQTTTATNGVQLGAASIMNYDVVYLTGNLLEQIKVDKDMVKTENAIVKQVLADKRYGKEPFYLTGTQGVEFGGMRWSSSTENWGSLGSDNPIFHSETWGVAGNQLTWALRHATVKYWVNVDAKGGITISYRLNDRLDLSGSKGRSEAYNNLSEGLGFFYHRLAGGNVNMQTRAEWTKRR